MKFGTSPLDIVIIGRSILSSHENPHAELYRGLINELAQHGHRTTFLEHVPPGKRMVRDMLRSPYCSVWTYGDTDQLLSQYVAAVQSADVVMLGSGVDRAEDVAVWIAEEAKGVTIYYDTNLDRTVRSLNAARKMGDCLSCRTIVHFNLFLSTTGGPVLDDLARENGLSFARPLYESVDPFSFYRTDTDNSYDMGFIGHYQPGRAERLRSLMFDPAGLAPKRRFAMAGGGYEATPDVPPNVHRIPFLPETNLVDFYNRQNCTLVVSRDDRKRMGYTPTRRLLAAAACGIPVLTDSWDGLEAFFEPGQEIFTVDDCDAVLSVLYGSDEEHRERVGAGARRRVLAEHTISHRAEQLLNYLGEVTD